MKRSIPICLALGGMLAATAIGAPDACIGVAGGEVCDQGIRTLVLAVLGTQALASGLVVFLLARSEPAVLPTQKTQRSEPVSTRDTVSVRDESKRVSRVSTDDAPSGFREIIMIHALRESSQPPIVHPATSRAVSRRQTGRT